MTEWTAASKVCVLSDRRKYNEISENRPSFRSALFLRYGGKQMNGLQAMGRYNELQDLVPALEIAIRDADDRQDYTASHVLDNALHYMIN